MTDQEARPIGAIIDGLGCAATIREGDLVAGAVVVLKIVDPDGNVNLSIAWSERMSWLERIGMLRAAEHLDLPEYMPTSEE